MVNEMEINLSETKGQVMPYFGAKDEIFELAKLYAQAVQTGYMLLQLWSDEDSGIQDDTRLKRLVDMSTRRIGRRVQAIRDANHHVFPALVLVPDDVGAVSVVPSDVLTNLLEIKAKLGESHG
jgi:hypothetical protein